MDTGEFAEDETFTVRITSDAEEASHHAATVIVNQIRRKPDSVICTASGETPVGTYARLAELTAGEHLADRISIVKLDEWLDIPLDDPHTCERFQREHVLGPLGVPAARYIGFDSQPSEEWAECRRIEREIERAGGIDLAVLGIGVNGHIGLNEPAEYLHLGCHATELAQTTIDHTMLEGIVHPVTRGITMGMRDILGARLILLLALGDHKAEPVQQLMSRRVSSRLPASFLWLHPNVSFICDRAAARNIAGDG